MGGLLYILVNIFSNDVYEFLIYYILYIIHSCMSWKFCINILILILEFGIYAHEKMNSCFIIALKVTDHTRTNYNQLWSH